MAFAASLYAVPDLPAPKRKPAAQADSPTGGRCPLSASELKRAASAEADRETRLKRKIEQAHRILNKIEKRQDDLAAQIRELQRRRAALAVRYERIGDRILHEMTEARLEKASGIRVTFSARLAPASLVVDDESLIPADYLREKIVASVDKIAIKQDLAKGQDVPGCHLEQKVSLVRK